jgi:phenylalanyl-tRNA synthetase beta chain
VAVPVIHFRAEDLEALLGVRMDRRKLLETIPQLGADVDKADGEEWGIEFFPNRPDLYSVEGIARALRAYLGKQPGLRRYPVAKPSVQLRIDASVRKVRPFLRAAVVRGLRFDHRRIQGLMELQEDLHWGVGARRRKASIGVHDTRALEPPYRYAAVGLDDVRFVPLQGSAEMTPREVLGKHPKGQAFAHLVGERAPLLTDSRDQVLSFPPIINGTLTTVTEATTDALVDCTGTDERAVDKALNIVATHLAEQGGRVEAVTVLEGKRKRVTPDLSPERWTVRPASVKALLGLDLTPAQMARALQRMGHGAKAQQGRLLVDVPAYRTDILHEVDLVEDVAIGHGYANFPYERPRAVTYGQPLAVERRCAQAREVLLGLGFTEVMTLSLSSESQQYAALGLEEVPRARVRNPVTEEHTMVRTSLLASLLGTLQKNVHRDYPQQVFEVGDVVQAGPEGMPANVRFVGWVRAHSRAGFSEAKGLALALARDLGLDADVTPAEPGPCVPGRCAALVARADSEVAAKGESFAWFGELHPRALSAFGLGQPAIAMELRLGKEALREA